MASQILRRAVQSSRSFWRGYNFAKNHAIPTQPAPYHSDPGFLENWLDSRTEGPGTWKWRHYFPVYERHLGKFRGQEVHILEIGVYSGGSMQMWKQYFGDKAHIYGVDIEPVCRQYEDEQTKIFIGDQADTNFWNDVLAQVPRIDIVVDDGGHQTDQQIATLEALLPHIQPGGVFICEDINGKANPFLSYMDGLARDLHAQNPLGADAGQDADPRYPYATLRPNSLQRLVDSIHTYPFVTVVEIRGNELARFSAPRHGTQWKPPNAITPW